jgi:hypothetical protein
VLENSQMHGRVASNHINGSLYLGEREKERKRSIEARRAKRQESGGEEGEGRGGMRDVNNKLNEQRLAKIARIKFGFGDGNGLISLHGDGQTG